MGATRAHDKRSSSMGSELNFRVNFRNPCSNDKNEEFWEVYRQLKYSALFSVPVFLMAVVLARIPFFLTLFSMHFGPFRTGDWLKWILVTPVQFIIGPRFYIAAHRALHSGSAPTDTLAILASSAAYTYAIVAVLYGALLGSWPQSYFEASVMLITFVLFGKYLEATAKGKSSQVIGSLLELTPSTALVLTSDAGGETVSEREVDVQEIQKGDILKVRPGSKIPIDGVVVSGSSQVDESMLTGEAAYVRKAKGDLVIGGAKNVEGVLHIRATRVGSDTALARIVNLVESVQMADAPILEYADYVGIIFVPIVVGLSASTWFTW